MFQGSRLRVWVRPQQRPQPQQGPAILPGDVLPEEATKDPAYRQGQGARYAQSQPDLAMKYGVLRGNRRIPPQLLGATPKVLKPETIEGLKAISEAQQVRAHAETGDAKIEQEAASGIAGAAGRLGNSPSDRRRPSRHSRRRRQSQSPRTWMNSDFNTFREMMMKDIINNEGQHKIIEARCSPIVIDDIVTMGFVKQRVPIVPGKFEPEFQSMRGDEDLAIKRLIMVENKGLEVTERYLLG